MTAADPTRVRRLAEAMARSKEALERAKSAAEAPACASCRFFSTQGMSGYPSWYRCHNPVVAPLSYNTVSGNYSHEARTPDEARSGSGVCGPEGLFYEPRGLIRRLRRWLADNI